MLHTVISESSNGNPEPRIEVEATGKTGRWLDAVLHLIAAHVELITPKKSPWVVNIAHGSGSFGWVALELRNVFPRRGHAGCDSSRRHDRRRSQAVRGSSRAGELIWTPPSRRTPSCPTIGL